MSIHRASCLCIGCFVFLQLGLQAQEALMPMRGSEFADFWSGDGQGKDSRTITSKSARGGDSVIRLPQKNQISLKLPSQGQRGEAKTRLVVIEDAGQGGVIDFSGAKQVRIQDNSSIPGMVEPEYLALEQCRIALPEVAKTENVTLDVESNPIVASTAYELEPVMLPPPLEPLTGRQQIDLAASSFRNGTGDHPAAPIMRPEEGVPEPDSHAGMKNQIYDPRLTLHSLRPPPGDAPLSNDDVKGWQETTASSAAQAATYPEALGEPMALPMPSIPGMGAVLKSQRQPEEDLVSPLGGPLRGEVWREAKDGIIPVRRLGPW